MPGRQYAPPYRMLAVQRVVRFTPRMPPDWNISESKTRALLVDPQLESVERKFDGRTQLLREIPVDGYDADLSHARHT